MAAKNRATRGVGWAVVAAPNVSDGVAALVSSHRTRNMATPRPIQTAAVEYMADLVPRWPRVRRWIAREMPKTPAATRAIEVAPAAMAQASGADICGSASSRVFLNARV